MYCTKNVGLGMEPWETPASTGNSQEMSPSGTTQNGLSQRNEKIRLKTWSEIPLNLTLWRRTVSKACQKPNGKKRNVMICNWKKIICVECLHKRLLYCRTKWKQHSMFRMARTTVKTKFQVRYQIQFKSIMRSYYVSICLVICCRGKTLCETWLFARGNSMP